MVSLDELRKKKREEAFAGEGFAFTQDGKGFILPEREKAKLAAKNETAQVQAQQQDKILRKELLAGIESQLPQEQAAVEQPTAEAQPETALQKLERLKQEPPSLANQVEKLKLATQVMIENPGEIINRAANEPAVRGAALAGGISAVGALGAGAGAAGTAGRFAGSLKSFGTLKGILTFGAIGGAIKLKASTAGNVLTISENAKQEILQSYEAGEISYDEASELWLKADANISEAHSSAQLLSKIDVFGFLGLIDTLQKFEWNNQFGLKITELEKAKLNKELLKTQANMLRSQINA